MRIVKGDKVKYLDLEGVAISNPYMYISYMETYIDVYCNDIKEIMTLKINDLEDVD
mgnify:CR=1 FL=1